MRLTFVGLFLLIGLSSGNAQKQNAAHHHSAAMTQRKVAAVAVPKAGPNDTNVQLKRLEHQTKVAVAKPQKANAAPPKIKAQPVGANKNAPIAFKAQHAPAKGNKAAAAPRTLLRENR